MLLQHIVTRLGNCQKPTLSTVVELYRYKCLGDHQEALFVPKETNLNSKSRVHLLFSIIPWRRTRRASLLNKGRSRRRPNYSLMKRHFLQLAKYINAASVGWVLHLCSSSAVVQH